MSLTAGVSTGFEGEMPMKAKETIEVFIDTKKGETVCICKRSRKRCGKNCQPDVVERDKFRGWETIMNRDRFGRG